MRERDPILRFFAKVEFAEECWLWKGMTTPLGYGYYSDANRMVPAYRWLYILCYGPIPIGLELDHLCRNSSCVNPDHLELVTHRANVLRGEGPSARNARKTHCAQGHELAGANVVQSRSERGLERRRCRQCRNEYHRYYRRHFQQRYGINAL
jgi:hypothetical protein